MHACSSLPAVHELQQQLFMLNGAFSVRKFSKEVE
jgi:hypothetical protein